MSALSGQTDYEAAFVARTPRSGAHFERASRVLPGGVTGNNKFMQPHPLYVQRAEGARLFDIDGNEYIDLLMGAGPLLLGHRPQLVVDAVREQLERGTLFILPSELEFELASRIQKHMPHLEQVRFANSGSEATIAALRVARAYTGRQRIAKFDGHFHGHANDNLSANSVVTSEGLVPAPDWAGIPERALQDLVLLPYNDIAGTVERIRAHGEELAAVIVEPVPFNSYGAVAPVDGFLDAIRTVTEEFGILLIFDEVITAFRLGLGGAAAYYGVTADLTTMGKIIGGGLSIGAFGGRREIFEEVVTPTRSPSDEGTKVFHSGTFTGNPLVLAAGIALLDELERRSGYESLATTTARLRQGLRAACRDADIEGEVSGVESMFHLHFTRGPIRTRADVLRSDLVRNRTYCFGLISQGIFMPLNHGGFLSMAHTDEDVDRVLEVASDVIAHLRRVPVIAHGASGA